MAKHPFRRDPVKYFLEVDGKRVPAHEIAKQNGISADAFMGRILAGWTVFDAATKTRITIRKAAKDKPSCNGKVDIHLKIAPSLLDQIDQVRGEETRTGWIVQLIQERLRTKDT